MDYIFFQVTAINGFDSLGHYLRAGLIANLVLVATRSAVAFGCKSNFGEAEVAGAAARQAERRRSSPRHAPTRPRPRAASRVGGARLGRRRHRARSSQRRAIRELEAQREAEPRAAPRRAPSAAVAALDRQRRAAAASTTCWGTTDEPAARRSEHVGSPVLVGAITLLVVIVAVFLSYNANSGLPFVPDLRPQGRAAERREPRGRATTCASAASASARVARSRRCRATATAPPTRRSSR